MTWGGSMMNWGGFGKSPPASPIERYHSGSGGYWEHKSHGHGSHKSSGKGGGSGAALSALALLAFLFLINVMQQSLQDNNATMPATGTTAVLLREDQQPISLNARASTGEKVSKTNQRFDASSSSSRATKGDVFGRNFGDREYT